MTHYYCLLVCDPSSNKNVFAPFISYVINQLHPTISGTYGQEYPIKMCPLTTTQVDYATEVITAEQQALFYSNTAFAPAINHVMDKFCPNNLAAAICQYRFFKKTQYTIQVSIKKLQEKEMQYVEKGVEVLSDLENTNALECIFTHEYDITQYVMSRQPVLCGSYSRVSYHLNFTIDSIRGGASFWNRV